jgi:CheY-like chemotaxis protein
MALTREYVSLEETIDAAMTAVRPLFDSKGLYLRKAMPERRCTVFCDRTRIQEVLLNLLSNAGRFTERGGVCVHVQPQEKEIVVSVSDTGTGIATRDQSKLFQPFHQVDGSIRRRYGGTGLGLSISKRFIELHGGKIWVESEQGVGTTFHFSLPAEQPTGEGFARWLMPNWEYVQRTRRSQAPRPVVRPCFVVLDGGGALQRLLARYLDDVEILPVTDLDEALDELSRVPARALLINESSVSRALEVLGACTALPNDVPVIVCSVPGLSEFSTAIGVSDRLVKPISREMLLQVLEGLGVSEGTVLIVDDEPDALQLFGRMLSGSEHDYRVLLARDGEEAIGVLEQYRPDVILLDLVMPNMDGFQFLEKRRGDAAWAEIPVIVVSARDPAGQPIVSSALAVTRGGGLSVHQLLTGIEALSKALSTTAPAGDPMSPGIGRG